MATSMKTNLYIEKLFWSASTFFYGKLSSNFLFLKLTIYLKRGFANIAYHRKKLQISQ